MGDAIRNIRGHMIDRNPILRWKRGDEGAAKPFAQHLQAVANAKHRLSTRQRQADQFPLEGAPLRSRLAARLRAADQHTAGQIDIGRNICRRIGHNQRQAARFHNRRRIICPHHIGPLACRITIPTHIRGDENDGRPGLAKALVCNVHGSLRGPDHRPG
jgi:hypothetical protein